MIRRALAAIALLLLAAACGQKPPVRDAVTIEFQDDGGVTLTQETELDISADTQARRDRVRAASDAAIAGTDIWSARFQRIAPAAKRTTLDERRGQLERITRSAAIEPDDIQQFFADSSLTFHLTNTERYHELSIYPGTPARATREQREHFNKSLEVWARAVARYYAAVDRLYAYLNENPGRAEYVFAAIVAQKQPDGLPTGVTEDEEPYVNSVIDSMMVIVDRLDDEAGNAVNEEADLVLNPFPSKLTIRTPGDLTASEGFTRTGTREVTIEPVDLMHAVESLEGRWITPDPLVTILREKEPDAGALATAPRKSTPVVTASEIVEAVRAKLARPANYVVRW
ncbi:MAG TPA: hypothetical protein VFN10_21240 [Thermoanaerobaculia bacterium]|nr:hypothetical protein [Thermoanaerobaculia bacterium]